MASDVPRIILTPRERDLDLFLLEELTSSPEFLRWFLSELGRREDYQVLEAAKSVATPAGESDLVIRLGLPEPSGPDLVVLVENKIDAALQPQQAERYQERAAVYSNEGCEVAIVLVAPQQYAGSDSDRKGFQELVTYEDLLRYLKSTKSLGLRAKYKAALLQAAISKAATGWIRVPDDATTVFHRRYWELASAQAPELQLPEPGEKPARAGWVRFPKLAKSVTLIHKARKGHVDLQLKRRGSEVKELREKYGETLEGGMVIEQAGKSAVVRVSVPKVRVRHPFEDNEMAVRKGIEAAQRLRRWYSNHAPL